MAGGHWATSVLVLTPLACWLAATSGSAQETAPAPAEIRVVHYNVRNYLAMPRRIGGEIIEAAPKPEKEKVSLVKILADAKPDIIGVCEMGVEADLADLQERLKSAGVLLPHRALVHAADAERHLAVLSRFPIQDRSRTNIVYRIDSRELPVQRGILDATIEVNPGYSLRLLAVHLKSRREVPEGDQAVMRRNEALRLREHVESILAENPNTNVLVIGDFNDTRNEPVVKTVQGDFGTKTYLRDLPLTDQHDLRWTYYWALADTYDRIDFAFVSSGLYPEIVRGDSFIATSKEWLDASDHRPLVIAIRPQDAPNRR